MSIVRSKTTSLVFAAVIGLTGCSGAIWPFNTTYMRVKLLCKNSAKVAERAGNSRDTGYTLADMLDGYSDPGWNKNPIDKLHKITYVQATRLAFTNKSISPEVLYDMQLDICYSEEQKYRDIFESLDR